MRVLRSKRIWEGPVGSGRVQEGPGGSGDSTPVVPTPR